MPSYLLDVNGNQASQNVDQSEPRSLTVHPESRVPNPESRVPNPLSLILHLVTQIPRPKFRISYPVAQIPRPKFRISYPVAQIPRPKLRISYPVTLIPSSFPESQISDRESRRNGFYLFIYLSLSSIVCPFPSCPNTSTSPPNCFMDTCDTAGHPTHI